MFWHHKQQSYTNNRITLPYNLLLADRPTHRQATSRQTLWLIGLLSQLRMLNDLLYYSIGHLLFHHCKWKLKWKVFYSNWLLNAPLYLTTFFMHYCNWLLLFALFQLTTFVLTIATEDYCILQNDIKTSVNLIATAHIN